MGVQKPTNEKPEGKMALRNTAKKNAENQKKSGKTYQKNRRKAFKPAQW